MLEEEVLRGERARQLLENKLLQEALKDIEVATIQRWEMANSTSEREDFWRLYKVTKLFKDLLEGHVQTGKMAAMELSTRGDIND